VLPVVDRHGSYRGVITAQAVAEALSGDADPGFVGDLTELPSPVLAEMPVGEALGKLVGTAGTGLPVLDAEKKALVGWITHQTMLAAFHDHEPMNSAG
jgi:CIC family chloride channel protein